MPRAHPMPHRNGQDMVQCRTIVGIGGAPNPSAASDGRLELPERQHRPPSRHGGRGRSDMKFGLSPLQAGGDFAETIRECEQAEAAGFDSVWLGEDHNHGTLYPTPLIGLAAIAGRTRKGRLGTAVLLLPLYHPLAGAGEGAMVALISAGRPIPGGGARDPPGEVAAFGGAI